MEWIITQQLLSKITQPGRHIKFSIKRNKVIYNITIEEDSSRKITILSKGSPTYPEKFQVFYDIERLIMLFEGHFHSVIEACEKGTKITHCFKARTLDSYISAQSMISESNVLLDFSQVLNRKMLSDWSTLQNKLDLIHKMYLYCVSNIPMPIDMKCAFMIESFSGIGEMLRKNGCIKPPKEQATLKYYLKETMKTYGADIFSQELKRSGKFAQILVDSRNRIAHIKNYQGTTVLDGNESAIYLMKLSLLYRKILFELLDIPQKVYSNNLQTKVAEIDKQDATKLFLKKLNPKQTT